MEFHSGEINRILPLSGHDLGEILFVDPEVEFSHLLSEEIGQGGSPASSANDSDFLDHEKALFPTQ